MAISNPSGVDGRTVPAAPQGVSAVQAGVMAGIYREAADRIGEATGRAVLDVGQRRSAAFAAQRGDALTRQIESILRRAGDDAAAAALAQSRQSWALGARQAGEQIRAEGIEPRSAGLAADSPAGFTVINEEAVERLAGDTVALLSGAAQRHGEQAQRIFRALSVDAPPGAELTANRAVARALIDGDPRGAQMAAREIFRDPGDPRTDSVRRFGARQVQVGGWTGSVRDYAAMVTITRTREATIGARHDTLIREGLELVQITGAVTVYFCTRFIGLVVSLAGGSPDYPALGDLPGGGPPFHPLCSKGTALFVPGVSSRARGGAHRKAIVAYRTALRQGTLTQDLA